MEDRVQAGVLEIGRAGVSEIARHGVEVYPEECCGFLVGGCDAAGVWVAEVERAENEHVGDRRRRFLISPERVLLALRRARERGFELVGYYHSHPDHPAEPSASDGESAWPGVSYLIVPVSAGGAGRARSWRVAADRSGFVEERVSIVEDHAEDQAEAVG